MKIKYKHQRFQAEATRCVTDVFQGQPKRDGLSNFLIDQGKGHIGFKVEGFGNAPLCSTVKVCARTFAPYRWRKA